MLKFKNDFQNRGRHERYSCTHGYRGIGRYPLKFKNPWYHWVPVPRKFQKLGTTGYRVPSKFRKLGTAGFWVPSKFYKLGTAGYRVPSKFRKLGTAWYRVPRKFQLLGTAGNWAVFETWVPLGTGCRENCKNSSAYP